MKISIFLLLVVGLVSFQDCDGYPEERMRKRTAKPSIDDLTDASSTSAGPKRSRKTQSKSMTANENTPVKPNKIRIARIGADAIPHSRRPRAIADEKIPVLMDMVDTGDGLPPATFYDTDNQDSPLPAILVPWWNAPISYPDPQTTKQPVAPKKK